MFIKLVALTVPLCLDSFLIATAIGMARPSAKQKLRISLLFAGFEAGMPLVGLLIGRSLSGSLGGMAEYIAIAILIGAGLYLLLRPDKEDSSAQQLASAHGLTILALGFGISLDGLAIGFTYGLLKLPILLVTAIIAVQAFGLSQAGFAVGAYLPQRLRAIGEKLANAALVVIGLILLAQKVLA